jgi:hypothetical protein
MKTIKEYRFTIAVAVLSVAVFIYEILNRIL